MEAKKEDPYGDRWSLAIDAVMRDYHESCLDRGFYYPSLMKKYGDRPREPSIEWLVYSPEVGAVDPVDL